jgi:hypothetical protein
MRRRPLLEASELLVDGTVILERICAVKNALLDDEYPLSHSLRK